MFSHYHSADSEIQKNNIPNLERRKNPYDLPSDAVKNFDYENYAVTRPDPSKHLPIIKFTRYVLDSRDRNTSLFPSPNIYELILNESINEVTSVKIVKCDVPLSNYDINEFNNILQVSFNGGPINLIEVPVGNYNTSINRTTFDTNTAYLADINAFASAVTTATNPIEPSFVCQYLSSSDSFAFTCSSQFTFNFQGTAVPYGIQVSSTYGAPIMITPYATNSIGKVLGFGPLSYSSSITTGSNNLNSVFRKNFQDNRYCVLHIDNMNVNNSINSNIFKSFAIIDGKFSKEEITKFFNPSVRLNKLRVHFTDYFGNPYNFRNYEHRIEMQFESTTALNYARFTNL